MTKILVTGAAGFLGSHLSDFLAGKGFDVIRSDVALPSHAVGSWVRADLRDFGELKTATRGVDAICHLGGIGDVYLAEQRPELAMLVNAYGTVNLIRAAQLSQVNRLIYASTWEVYGKAQSEPVDEKHPCSPTHPYSISKFAGDLAAQYYDSEVPPSGVVLRLGTAYGPRMRSTAVIPAFVGKAMRGEAISVHGAGDQFRQFTHATDIARAFMLALEADRPGPIYNVVSEEKTRILDLAETIATRFGVDLELAASRPHDAPSVTVSSSLIGRDLGWRAVVPLKRGLDEFIESLDALRGVNLAPAFRRPGR